MRKWRRGENDAVLDDSLLAQAFRLIGLDPAQGFKQCRMLVRGDRPY